MLQMRKANQALVELAAQQKAVALGGSAKAQYREAQVTSANECLHRLELTSLEDLQQEIAAMQQQLEIDEQVHEVGCKSSCMAWVVRLAGTNISCCIYTATVSSLWCAYGAGVVDLTLAACECTLYPGYQL